MINTPASAAGTYPAAGSSFGPALTPTGITAESRWSTTAARPRRDACQRSARNALTGKIAIIDRGTCSSPYKVLNAQRAGAIGVIIANNAGDDVFTMGGTERASPSPLYSSANRHGRRWSPATNATLRKANPAPLIP